MFDNDTDTPSQDLSFSPILDSPFEELDNNAYQTRMFELITNWLQRNNYRYYLSPPHDYEQTILVEVYHDDLFFTFTILFNRNEILLTLKYPFSVETRCSALMALRVCELNNQICPILFFDLGTGSLRFQHSFHLKHFEECDELLEKNIQLVLNSAAALYPELSHLAIGKLTDETIDYVYLCRLIEKRNKITKTTYGFNRNTELLEPLIPKFNP